MSNCVCFFFFFYQDLLANVPDSTLLHSLYLAPASLLILIVAGDKGGVRDRPSATHTCSHTHTLTGHSMESILLSVHRDGHDRIDTDQRL